MGMSYFLMLVGWLEEARMSKARLFSLRMNVWWICFCDGYFCCSSSWWSPKMTRHILSICAKQMTRCPNCSFVYLYLLLPVYRVILRFFLLLWQTSIRDTFGNTPLHLACNKGDLDCVRALTERITASEESKTTTASSYRHQIFYPDLESRNYHGKS